MGGERGPTSYSNTLLESAGHIGGYLVSGRLDSGALPGSLSFELLNHFTRLRRVKPRSRARVVNRTGGDFNDAVTGVVIAVGTPYSRGCWHGVSPPEQLGR